MANNPASLKLPLSPRLRRASRKTKRAVVIGGGAISESILPALRNLKFSITTVTSMADSGGSSGALRKEFDIHPAGDIRRHILALSEAEDWKKSLWKFRFANNI